MIATDALTSIRQILSRPGEEGGVIELVPDYQPVAKGPFPDGPDLFDYASADNIVSVRAIMDAWCPACGGESSSNQTGH